MQTDLKDPVGDETVNEEAAAVIGEAELLKADHNKKTYNPFSEIMEETDNEQ